MAIKPKGNDNVLKNLNTWIRKQRGLTVQGIADALSLIQRKAIRKTPVATGNLKGSFYMETGKIGTRPVGVIGNKAEYAIYVHENLDNHHPKGEAKFLVNAIIENIPDITRIITSRLKV